jgi:Raf kinase inhibitor-like YbhB/YbcL family protein
MRRVSLAVLLTLAAAAPLAAQAPTRAAGAAQRAAAPAAPFTMEPLGWLDGGLLPYKYSQAAYEPEWKGGISPQLTWSNVPAGTKSFVLHEHDMDVARQKGTEDQLHWLVWNIPGDVKMLKDNAAKEGLPEGALQINGRGEQGYLGAGAPATAPLHHYMFELIALDIPKINVQPGTDGFATRKQVMAAMNGHVLGKALVVGLFHRPPPIPATK